ncbi:MAG: hypothetical protein R3E83_17840 [Burkholderiaceae bacterium]
MWNPRADISRPRYLNDAVDEFPQTLENALRKEVMHLYENAVELILHGLNLHRHEVYASENIVETVNRSRSRFDLNIDAGYEQRVKTLYSAIVEFASRAGSKRMPDEIANRIYELRDVASGIVQAVKSVKHVRKNMLRYTTRPQGAVTELYDGLRCEFARVVVQLRKLEQAEAGERSALWLDHELVQIEDEARSSSRRVDAMIRERRLEPSAATSFLNDSGYAYGAMRRLIEAARAYYIEADAGVAEVEKLLSLDEEEILAAAGARTAGAEGGRHGHDT